MRKAAAARKGSYFFVIDAFVAGIILVGAIVALFTSFSRAPPASQAFYTAEDFLVVLETTKISDYDSATVRNWTADGTINDTSLSLLQQIGYFNASGRDAQARTLANLTLSRVPESVSAQLLIGNQSYAMRGDADQGKASVFFSSKRILLLRKRPSDLYSPVIVEVRTWQ